MLYQFVYLVCLFIISDRFITDYQYRLLHNAVMVVLERMTNFAQPNDFYWDERPSASKCSYASIISNMLRSYTLLQCVVYIVDANVIEFILSILVYICLLMSTENIHTCTLYCTPIFHYRCHIVSYDIASYINANDRFPQVFSVSLPTLMYSMSVFSTVTNGS